MNFRQRPVGQADVIDRARREDTMIYAIGLRSRRSHTCRQGLGRAVCGPLCWPICPIQVWLAWRKRPAAGTPKFDSAGSGCRVCARRRRVPRPVLCLGSHHRNATAKCTISASRSIRAARSRARARATSRRNNPTRSAARHDGDPHPARRASAGQATGAARPREDERRAERPTGIIAAPSLETSWREASFSSDGVRNSPLCCAFAPRFHSRRRQHRSGLASSGRGSIEPP